MQMNQDMLALMRETAAMLKQGDAVAATEKIQQRLAAMMPAAASAAAGAAASAAAGAAASAAAGASGPRAWAGFGAAPMRDINSAPERPSPGHSVPYNRVPYNRAQDSRAPDSRAPDSRAPDSRAPDINADFVPDLLASLGIAMPAGALQAEADLSRAPADAAPSAAGQFLAASFGNEAGTRSYKLYIPSGYHGQALPLVVMLHGCKQHPDDFAAGTRFNDIAEQTPCLVLYPAQAPSANVSACWNWFSADDQQRDRGEPAILAGMTEQVIARYHVDPAQVYVAGLSAGAAMALIMGSAYPELYAAIGIHSGLPVGAAHDLPTALAAMKRGAATAKQPLVTPRSLRPGRVRPGHVRPGHARPGYARPGCVTQPIIVFHGERDPTVHPRNADQIIARSMAGGGADDSTKVTNVTNVTEGRVAGGHAYTRTVHQDGDGNVVAEQWLVHGAGHAWSGGSSSGSYTDRKGPDASQEMMRFFAASAQQRD